MKKHDVLTIATRKYAVLCGYRAAPRLENLGRLVRGGFQTINHFSKLNVSTRHGG